MTHLDLDASAMPMCRVIVAGLAVMMIDQTAQHVTSFDVTMIDQTRVSCTTIRLATYLPDASVGERRCFVFRVFQRLRRDRARGPAVPSNTASARSIGRAYQLAMSPTINMNADSRAHEPLPGT